VFFLFPILGFWVGGWVVFFVFNFGFLGGKGVGGGGGGGGLLLSLLSRSVSFGFVAKWFAVPTAH
jgi:hypothetical protein